MSMGYITHDGRHFRIEFKPAAHIVEAVKELPERRYIGSDRVWQVPIKYRERVEDFARKMKLELGYLIKEEPEQDFSIKPLPELLVDIPLKRALFPYQRSGVAYLLDKKCSIVGDQPGLGKTGQSIAAVTAQNAFPCLVICPSSLKINWQREWHLWTSKKAIVLQDSVKNTFPEFYRVGAAQVFITNYESLKKFFVQSINPVDKGKRFQLKDINFKKHIEMFASVIIDESHRLKDSRTQQYKFARGLTKGKEIVLALTGTPVINKPIDLAPQLNIINRFQEFGGFDFYRRRYCSGPKEASNLKELNYKLNEICFYRRDKSEVLKDLPAKMRQIITCEISQASRIEYNHAMSDLESYLSKYTEASDSDIRKSMKGEIMVRIGILKNISAKGKLADVYEFIDDIIDSGEKLVVFGHLKEVIGSLKEKYPKAVGITGANSMEERQQAVDAFQNDPKVKLIICSLKAASVGLTLTAASRVAFVELPWTAADCEQAEDRCHRIGQKDSVQCTYFLGKDTIDEKIYKIIDAKRNIANIVVGAEDNVETTMIDNLIDLFNQK